MPKTGRPSLFRGKDLQNPIKSYMTKVGLRKVGEARTRLAKLCGWKAADIRDGDVVEFLARGEANTVEYLKQTDQFVTKGRR